MSYPGQPGPYGQQPDPYGQQPYWQQGGPTGWGPPPPPPRKSNAGMWAGLTIAVVLVAALGVTGFAWPGFFLAGEDKPAAAGDQNPGGGASCEQPSGDDAEKPEPVAKALVSCINAKDKDGLGEFACEDASSEVTRMVGTVTKVDRAKLLKTSTVSDDEARADIEVAVGDKTESFQAVLVKSDETWCWKRTDSAGAGGPKTSARGKPSGKPSSRPSGPESKIGQPSGEGGQVLTRFLEALNKKDAAAAGDLVCQGAKLSDGVDDVIKRNPQLVIEEATETETWINARLDGTLDGKISGGIVGGQKKDGRWCVDELIVF